MPTMPARGFGFATRSMENSGPAFIPPASAPLTGWKRSHWRAEAIGDLSSAQEGQGEHEGVHFN